MKKIDYSLYVCTDRNIMTSATVEESVEAAIKGGAGIIQLREKNCTSRFFYEEAIKVQAVCRRYEVPLIINDRFDIALAVGAAGVHVGPKDLPCKALRKIAPKDFIIGVSASSPEIAAEAEQAGADYLGVGAMFSTSTKDDARALDHAILPAIRRAVDIPIVLIGGVNQRNLNSLKGYGFEGLAVISAVVAADDPEAAAAEILRLWHE